MSIATSTLRRTLLTNITPRAFRPIQIPRTTITPSNPIRTFTSTSKMSKDGVHNLTSATEFKSNLREGPEDKLAVLDCFATWCGPCKVIAPKIVEFSEKYPDVSFYKIDVDEQAEVAAELGVHAMPTFFFFKNGKVVAEVVGANPAAVEAAIKGNM